MPSNYPLRNKLRSAALVAGISLLFAGCAVMTVDVDVYKGPLANHEELQVEQVAAVAMAAKPLLVGLRDQVEWGPDAADLRSQSWYRGDYIETNFFFARVGSNQVRTPIFNNDLAIRVNAILSLYKDIDSGERRSPTQPGLLAEAKAVAESVLASANKEQSLAELEEMWMAMLQVGERKGDVNSVLSALSLCDPLYLLGVFAVANEANVPYSIRHVRQDHLDFYLPRNFFSASTYRTGDGQIWNADAVKMFLESFRRLTLEYPNEAARALRACSEFFDESDTLLARLFRFSGLPDRYATPTMRRWGYLKQSTASTTTHNSSTNTPIVDVPPNTNFTNFITREVGTNLQARIADVTSQLWRISGGADLGFTGGRVDDGLEKLIKTYLVTKDSATNRRTSTHRANLLDGLVHFAEKVSFIANSEALFTKETTWGDNLHLVLEGGLHHLGYLDPLHTNRFLGFVPTSTNSLIRGRHTYGRRFGAMRRQSNLDTAQLKRAKPYTQVLQAIGNSIMVQVNEIRHRDDYKSSLGARAELETQVLHTLRGVTNSHRSHYLLQATNYNYSDPKALFDHLIGALRDQEIMLTAEGNTNAMLQVRAAAELARLYRSDFIYIRPPAVYLRSSYPATTLQRNTRVAWENMLDKHMYHSVPFVNTLAKVPGVSSLLGIDDVSNGDAVAEIDKQFWQNINRIRVASAGFSSYAVVKDDIGNWYVKSYLGDPTPIIQGAEAVTGLATAQGALSNASALKNATGTNTFTTNSFGRTECECGALAAAVSAVHAARAEQQLTNFLTRLRSLSAALSTNAVPAVTNDLSRIIDDAAVQKSNGDPSSEILSQALNGVKRFLISHSPAPNTEAHSPPVAALLNDVGTLAKATAKVRRADLENYLALLAQIKAH